MKQTLITLGAIVVLLVSGGSISAGQGFGGAARDADGNLYVLDMSGNIAVLEGQQKRSLIAGSGLRMDVSVIRGELVVVVRDDSMNGVLETYSLDGRKLRSVALAERFWPQRVAEFGERIAVLGTSPEAGAFIEFLDRDLKVIPDARLYVTLECDTLGWVDMAVGANAIYVAPFQQCRDGYLVRKFDAAGNIVAEFTGSLKQSPNETVTDDQGNVGTTYTLAIKDVFATPEYVGVVLGVPGPRGTMVDFWTHSGKFVERIVVPGVFSPIARGLSTSDGSVVLLGMEDENIARTVLPQLDLSKMGGAK